MFLARVDLTAITTCPTVTLSARLLGATKELRAYERCNLHGVWVSSKPITVTD